MSITVKGGQICWRECCRKMPEKKSETRQWYKTIDGDEVVNKVKQVLKDHFHIAAAMQVVEL